jgi:hypothetical protein
MRLAENLGDANGALVCQEGETSRSARRVAHDGTRVDLAVLRHIRAQPILTFRQPLAILRFRGSVASRDAGPNHHPRWNRKPTVRSLPIETANEHFPVCEQVRHKHGRVVTVTSRHVTSRRVASRGIVEE